MSSLLSLSENEGEILKGLLANCFIRNNTVSIANVNMSRGAISCTKVQLNTLSTDSITSLNSDTITINDTTIKVLPKTLRTTFISAIDSNGLHIEGIQISNDTLFTNKISGINGEQVQISGTHIHDGVIYSNMYKPKTGNVITIGDVNIQDKKIQLEEIVQLNDNGVRIENTLFNNDITSIHDLKVKSISGYTDTNIQLLDNTTINNVHISDSGDVSAKSINVLDISAPNNGTLNINGRVGLSLDQLDYGDNGFRVENIILRNGVAYVRELLSINNFNNPESNVGMFISDVELNNGNIICNEITANAINMTSIKVDRIHEQTPGNGVDVNGILMKDRGVMIPAIDILDDSNMEYATLFYSNELQKIFIETPDGDNYIPPKTVSWSDWTIYNNDPSVQLLTTVDTHTRFSVVDQSCFISMNLRIRFTGDSIKNTVWVTLPDDYLVSNNLYSTFAMIDEINTSNVIQPLIGKVYADGIINHNLLYLELPHNFKTNHEYRFMVNLVYEYVSIRQALNNPWQSWYPIRKDDHIQDINIHTTRFFKSGSNTWINFDISIKFNENVNHNKESTMISLPPNTIAKKLYYSAPIIITSGINQYIGIVSTGSKTNDTTQEGCFSFTMTDSFFNPSTTYRFKGQLLFEDATLIPVDFFFNLVDVDVLVGQEQNTSNYQFQISDQVYGTVFEVDSDNVNTLSVTEQKWVFHMSENHNLSILSYDGFAYYEEALIMPNDKYYYSAETTPWRFVKDTDNNNIYMQFTVDGKQFETQVAIIQ